MKTSRRSCHIGAKPRLFRPLRTAIRASSEKYELDNVLSRVAVSLEPLLRPLRLHQELVVRGGGTHLGMAVQWQCSFKGDGAFVEDIVTEHLQHRLGHTGEEGTSCWEVDDTGLSRNLDLDDHEVVLMGAWVRTGLWLQPPVREQLELTLIPMDLITLAVDLTEVLGGQQAEEQPLPPLPPPAGPGVPLGGSTPQLLVQAAAAAERGPGSDAPATAPSTSGAFDPSAYVAIGLQLKNRKAMAQVVVCRNTWQPRAVLMPLCGEVEVWRFDPWSWIFSEPPRQQTVRYPRNTVHWAATGGRNTYNLESVSIRPLADPTALTDSYRMPHCPLLPEDASFDPPQGAYCKGWRTPSGHVLVRPRIDGREVGYMMLDTGASGLVIEKGAADRLKMRSFGEIYVSGVSGKVPSTFRQANDIQVGPLKMTRPMFMEMSLAGLVRGAPGPVIGIIGYDIFRRCVMDIPGAREYQQSSQAAAEVQRGAGPATPGPDSKPLSIFSPRSPRSLVRSFVSTPYEEVQIGIFPPGTQVDAADAELRRSWRRLRWVSLLPHVMSQMVLPNQDQCYGLMMVDSGAGGTEVMLSASSVKELKLDRPGGGFGQADSFREIRGVGGDSNPGMRVRVVEVPSLSVSGASFFRVSCLCVTDGAFDLSQYLAGVVCGDLLAKVRLVIDYPGSRIALVPHNSALDN